LIEYLINLVERGWGFLAQFSMGWARWVAICVLPFALYFVFINPFAYIFRRRWDTQPPTPLDKFVRKIIERLPFRLGYVLLPVIYIAVLAVILNLIGTHRMRRLLEFILPSAS